MDSDEEIVTCVICGVKNKWANSNPIMWCMEKGTFNGQIVCEDCLIKKHGYKKEREMVEGDIPFEY